MMKCAAFTWEKDLLCKLQGMMIGNNIDIRSSQVLTMTPRLQQAIKLLQMSLQEVSVYVTEQIQENPLLMPAEDMPVSTSMETEGETSDVADVADIDSPESDYELEGSSFIEEHYHKGEPPLDQIQSKTSLREYLRQQLAITITDPFQYKIGEYLIDSLNEKGYIEEDLNLLSERLEIPFNVVLEVLLKLQQFDPPGIFARNLAECFALQLRDKQQLQPEMEKLLEKLEFLLTQPLQKIAQSIGITLEQCQELLGQLKTLTPFPTAHFDHTPVETMVPDVIMHKDGENSWSIALNMDVLPQVLVNSDYYHLLKKRLTKHDDKTYLNAKLSHASWLVNALQQRAATILKVASEIVKQQEEFFLYGFSHFKPLNLRQVAESLEIHESTVSRVTTSKYIATPRGIFDFKFFFSASVNGGASNPTYNSESGFSARTIQERIRQIIQKEDPNHPLSDDTLVEKLESEGIPVARRTITKYRKLLGLPSSTERKRFYQLNGTSKQSQTMQLQGA